MSQTQEQYVYDSQYHTWQGPILQSFFWNDNDILDL